MQHTCQQNTRTSKYLTKRLVTNCRHVRGDQHLVLDSPPSMESPSHMQHFLLYNVVRYSTGPVPHPACPVLQRVDQLLRENWNPFQSYCGCSHIPGKYWSKRSAHTVTRLEYASRNFPNRACFPLPAFAPLPQHKVDDRLVQIENEGSDSEGAMISRTTTVPGFRVVLAFARCSLQNFICPLLLAACPGRGCALALSTLFLVIIVSNQAFGLRASGFGKNY